jgi:FtsH-binding integral membrane protein
VSPWSLHRRGAVAIIGALALYLDFINLFLLLLQLA